MVVIIDFVKKIILKIIKSKNAEKIVPFLSENKKIVLSLAIVAVFVDIFFINTNSDFVIFSILLIYAFFVKIFQIRSRLTFLLCLGLLGAMFINYIFTGTSVATEKAAVWLVLFMALGIFQQWRESY